MTKKLFVYIGLQKCLSSYLQEKFFSKHPEIGYLGERNPIGRRSPSIYQKLQRALFPSYKYSKSNSMPFYANVSMNKYKNV